MKFSKLVFPGSISVSGALPCAIAICALLCVCETARAQLVNGSSTTLNGGQFGYPTQPYGSPVQSQFPPNQQYNYGTPPSSYGASPNGAPPQGAYGAPPSQPGMYQTQGAPGSMPPNPAYSAPPSMAPGAPGYPTSQPPSGYSPYPANPGYPSYPSAPGSMTSPYQYQSPGMMGAAPMAPGMMGATPMVPLAPGTAMPLGPMGSQNGSQSAATALAPGGLPLGGIAGALSQLSPQLISTFLGQLGVSPEDAQNLLGQISTGVVSQDQVQKLCARLAASGISQGQIQAMAQAAGVSNPQLLAQAFSCAQGITPQIPQGMQPSMQTSLPPQPGVSQPGAQSQPGQMSPGYMASQQPSPIEQGFNQVDLGMTPTTPSPINQPLGQFG